MKVLVDTCVIIDALQSRQPFAPDAEQIFLLAANQKFDAFISAKSSTDIFYLTRKVTHSNEMTREILNRIFRIFELLDTAGIDCKSALVTEISSDYEDAVMIETAKRTGMDCIITRNEHDYSKSYVPVYSPEEFLKKFQNTPEES